MGDQIEKKIAMLCISDKMLNIGAIYSTYLAKHTLYYPF